jgi:hypothetical protein
VQFLDIGQSGHGVKSAAPNDSYLCL